VLADFEHRLATVDLGDQPLRALVPMLRQSVRTPNNRVWHELLAAARTDDQLRRRLEPSTWTYVHGIRRLITRLLPTEQIPPEQLHLWLQLFIHLFNGEAIFSVVARIWLPRAARGRDPRSQVSRQLRASE